MNAVQSAQSFTRTKVDHLRAALRESLPLGCYSVILGGSYARGEASSESDLDYYIITEGDCKPTIDVVQDKIRNILTTTVKAPSDGGPFATVHSSDSMQKNIGGDDDNNRKFTVRMLFLTEGEWLFNRELFLKVRDQLVRRYIRPHLKKEYIGKFFLNDTIRYYRTICVDFENKTTEKSKHWGPRNIKLVFSRKLLYFSGLLVSAELAGCEYEEKIQCMLSLMEKPPLERVRFVCGSKSDAALSIYDYFLGEFAKKEVRDAVAGVRPDDDSRETNSIFRDLKDKGHQFSKALIALMREQYPPNHPIHDALLM